MDLQIISYNSTGFNPAKADFIRFLVTSLQANIFLVQEHFLLHNNVFKIQKEFSSFNSYILPANKSNKSLSCGRPSGGLGIFWKHSYNKMIKIVKLPNSTRIQAIDFDNKIIIVNCYFPTDTQDNNFDDWELIKCLETLSGIITAYPNHHILIGGDINCDFSRQTPFVNMIRDFTLNSNLSAAWWSFPIDFTYSFSSNIHNRTSFSCLDHFFYNDSLQVKDAAVIHLGDNLSGHEPIYISININVTDNLVPDSSTHGTQDYTYAPNWSKASVSQLQDFNESLRTKCQSLVIPDGLLCNNLTCQSDDHRNDITHYCDALLNIIDDATKMNIPPTHIPSEKKTPGWLELVKPFQDEARFFHSIWVSYGKPQNCPLYETMKRTRNSYHYAIRRAQKNEEEIRNQHLVDHCLKGNSSDIIKEFKKQNKCTQNKSPVIDGHSNDQNISNHFSDIYKDLYQRNSSTAPLTSQIQDINSSITSHDFNEVERLTPSVVYQAIKCLKSCKNDNIYNFKSDAFINGIDVLTNNLTLLFQAFLIHGFVPQIILMSTLQPIIKDKLGDKCSSSNYRAIGGSSLLLKLIDNIVLILFGESFKLAEQQFGFQKSSSTTLCSWTVKETINFFLNRDTPVYTCFLDLTKAFDLVNYSKLFQKLKHKISPLFLRLLAVIYLNQKCDVRWNGCRSPQFDMLNGVKQGAILSPTLFSIYIDDLFYLLKSSGLGCYINEHFYGALSYADDIVLMSPSVVGLQNMINFTKSYLDNLGLTISINIINPDKSKTKCLAFGIKRDPLPLIAGEKDIPWTNKYVHLGHVFYKDGSSEIDCVEKSHTFMGKYHSLCQLLKLKDPMVYMKLINIYLCDFYGSNLWYLFGAAAEKFDIVWNKMIRFVFNLPFDCHRYLIEPLSHSCHLKTKLTDRFLKFFHSISCSHKDIIQNLFFLQVNDLRSDFGLNVHEICHSAKVENICFVNRGDVKYHPIPDNEKWRVDIINEIILILSQNLFLDFDKFHLKFLLDFLSAN